MKITIAKKLMGSFLSLSLIVLIAGATGMYMVKRVAGSGEEVIEEKVPIKDAAMEAIIAAEKALNACRNYLGSEEDLGKIEGAINEQLGYLNMWISMVEYGTESEAFKNSPAGGMYLEKGFKVKVPRGDGKMIELVETINKNRSDFTKRAAELIKNHNRRVEYSFVYNDVRYNLSSFLYAADKRHRKWAENLRSSVNYNIDFVGELDPAKCFVGAWLVSYETRDEELAEMLDGFKSVHIYLHETVEKVVAADSDGKKSMLSFATPVFSQALNNFNELEEFADEKINAIEKRERASVGAMFEASAKMVASLDALKVIADEGMHLAQKNAKAFKNNAQWMLTALIFIAVAMALVFGFLITQSITAPLTSAVELAEKMAQSDFSKGFDIDREDEVGVLGTALNSMSTRLRGMMREIKENADALNNASEIMSTVSASMASNAGQMNTRSNSVAASTEEMSMNINAIASAAEEMSVNIQSVSSTAEQMSQNMNAVATAIEEMSVSISDVAASAKEGSDIAGQAMEMSDSATETMNVLGKAAKEIGEVTDVIKTIAGQTNLLALNATIEAASAGDAGKGFAVVAKEIKELANQSAHAAEDIARRIQGVQANTGEAVDGIHGISDVIHKINASSEVIAKSVEQQTLSANEISGNVQQANSGTNNIASAIAEIAKGANDMAKSAAESVSAVNEVSANIQSVSQAAGDANSGARQVHVSAAELVKIAVKLKEMVGKFKVE
ncbi:MAG: HAMP domain-containing protein [Deltaproteobacteria bacterium]|nr:HAMP domain-containing protein [Deltaproteobacteria bacterium]